jgi:CheY-like chemotaxis protein
VVLDRKIKILIVEDNPVNMKLVTDILELDGFEVHTCQDAERALVILAEMHPDLILMDVALPGMDGLELTRRLKANENTKDIKIVALSAFAMKTDKDKAMAAGCNGYITKPINTRIFTKQIIDLLN